MMNSTINGAQIHYVDVGDRSALAIVLIHGFPFSLEMWNPQIDFLKDRFRVVAYDVRGHGRSEVGDGQYTLELLVDDLMGLLGHLGLDRVVLCGLSMGGYIALRAVERNPELFCGLILCDTSSNADQNESKLKRAASIKGIKRDGVKPYAEEFMKAVLTQQTFQKKVEVAAAVRGLIESNSVIGICGTLLALAGRTETTPSLPKITVPTLILVGEHDRITPPELSEKMHALIPNSELRVVLDAAHLSNLEPPEDFNRHLFNFLGKLI